MTANGTGIGLNTLFGMSRLLGNNAAVIGAILRFVCVTTAGSGVRAIVVVRPVAPLVISGLCNRFRLGAGANRAGIGLNTFLVMGGLFGHNTGVPRTISRLGFIAAAGTTVSLSVVIRCPIGPAMHVLQLVDRLGFGMTALGTGVGSNTFGILGGLCRDYTLVPAVCSSACAATNGTGLLVIGITVRCPVTPTVGFALGGNTAVTLTGMGMGVCSFVHTIVDPLAPIMVKSINGFNLGRATIVASVGLNTCLGAGGSLGFYAVIPTVSLGFGLAAGFILAGTGMGFVIFIINPIAPIAGVGIYGRNIVTVEPYGILGVIGFDGSVLLFLSDTFKESIFTADEIVLIVILPESEGKHRAAYSIKRRLIQQKISFCYIFTNIAVCYLLCMGFGTKFILVSVSIVSYFSGVEINNPVT